MAIGAACRNWSRLWQAKRLAPLKAAEKEIGAPVTVTGFIRYVIGEGIDKETTDFAAEVAAAAGQG